EIMTLLIRRCVVVSYDNPLVAALPVSRPSTTPLTSPPLPPALGAGVHVAKPTPSHPRPRFASAARPAPAHTDYRSAHRPAPDSRHRDAVAAAVADERLGDRRPAQVAGRAGRRRRSGLGRARVLPDAAGVSVARTGTGRQEAAGRRGLDPRKPADGRWHLCVR